MRLKALRLREVGRFSKPVEVEGFSGGLDVLIAPNEAGKSTLLKALKTVFFHKHTATGQWINSLVPYDGGAPLIEVDFEAGNGSWRLRKQYLADRSCVLTDLATGKVVGRGEEAHARSLELFSGGSDGRDLGVAGFLMLEQKTWMEEAAPSTGAQSAIERVLEVELSSAAGLSGLREVLAGARDDLAKLLTGHTPPRPTGRLKAAIDRREQLAARLEVARRVAAEAAGRQEQLAALTAERLQHLNPVETSAQSARLQESSAAVDAARRAREHLLRAEAAYRMHESAHRLARTEAERGKALLQELAKLEEAARERAVVLAKAENELQTRLARHADVQSLYDAAKARLDAARRALNLRHRADRRAADAKRLQELENRIEQARAIELGNQTLAADIKSLRATQPSLSAAEREARSIAEIEARIAAGSPEVVFDLSAEAAGKVRIDGRPISATETRKAIGPMRVVIEGIGSIFVTPAQSDDRDSDAADLDSHRQQLAEILAGVAAGSLEALRDLVDKRHRLERELATQASKLAAVAPAGAGALRSEAERLRNALGDPVLPGASEDYPERGEAEAAVAGAENALDGVGAELAEVGEAASAAREAVGRHQAESQAAGRRLSEVTAQLPAKDARAGWLEELTRRLSDAERALSDAAVERGAWRDRAPDEREMARLEQTAADVVEERRRWSERREAIEREIATLDGMLERDREAAHQAALEGLEGELADARREVEMGEADAAALQLLIGAASGIERETRDTLLKPVLERVSGYVSNVLPGGSVDLGAGLLVMGLSREGRKETAAALSQGTREQIAVLVRLGVARLLADSGAARPFVLDDVLVYSDDERMRGMFENLRRAATYHQVVVLSCRSRAFEALGGNTLRIIRWRPG